MEAGKGDPNPIWKSQEKASFQGSDVCPKMHGDLLYMPSSPLLPCQVLCLVPVNCK